RERLRVRVVHPEDADALPDPVADDVSEREPELRPVGRLEVERVDVLVLLRRVLGVLDRAVRALAEPGRVLADEGVIGRGLERDVEGNGDPPALGRRDERPEVLERAEIRMDRRVAALGTTDRPRHPWVPGA